MFGKLHCPNKITNLQGQLQSNKNSRMQQEITKLKLTNHSRSEKKTDIVVATFIDACEKLDASVFEPLIEEDQMFEDLDKYRFLESLKNVFDRAKANKSSSVTLRKGACKGCQKGHDTHEFFSKNGFEFAYILERDANGELEDIFECAMSSGYLIRYEELCCYDEPVRDPISEKEQFEKMAENNKNLQLLKDTFDLEVGIGVKIL